MTRRYGRNQKRRAREALALAEYNGKVLHSKAVALHYQVQELTGAFRQSENKCRALQAAVRGMEDALGPNSILLAPVLLKLANAYLPNIKLADYVMRRYGPVSIMGATDEIQEESISHTMYSMIEAAIEPEHWSRKQHFMIKFEDRTQAVYAIDERTLFDRGSHRVLEQNLVPMLVKRFLEQMAGGRR